MTVDDRGRLGARLLVVAVGVVFLPVGVGLGSLAAFGEYQDLGRTDRLETAEGTIDSTTVERAQEPGTESGEVDTEYYPRATDTDAVDGETYEGNRVYAPSRTSREPGESRGKDFDERDGAVAAVDYQSGDGVTVYYYPDDPTTAFLRPPQFSLVAFLVPVVVGLAFAAVGGGLAVGGLTGRIDGGAE